MQHFNWAISVPQRLYVACSGGVDSVVLAHSLSEWRDVALLHYAHADSHWQREREVVAKLATRLGVKLIASPEPTEHAPKRNAEAEWRSARYEWFDTYTDRPVATGHTLDDAVEHYLITALRGEPHMLPFTRNHVIRPLLYTRKAQLVEYATEHGLQWYDDVTNYSGMNQRALIRRTLMPAVLDIQPGIHNMVRRRLEDMRRRQLTYI